MQKTKSERAPSLVRSRVPHAEADTGKPCYRGGCAPEEVLLPGDRTFGEVVLLARAGWNRESAKRPERTRRRAPRPLRTGAVRQDGSRPVSRVLSRAAIHLGRASPRASCDLPGSGAGHACRSPIWSCSGWGLPCHRCCHRRGALLPHLFTLTRARRAVCFLWHCPWARAPQALPGTLPCGARTFLPAARCGAAAARPTPAAPVSASRFHSATEKRGQSGISRSREIPL